MAWEENSCICLHMQLITILSRIGVYHAILRKRFRDYLLNIFYYSIVDAVRRTLDNRPTASPDKVP